ncbi:MAG: PEP-CTERM sorting domain-containing protein [Sedimentisphaerales bacterium]|nr:PEP-CTERM sorting domain-containing protein [Sedimentisphaerales bacterium]
MKYTLNKSILLYLSVILFFPHLSNATILGTVDLTYAGYGANDSMLVWGGYIQGMPVYAGVAKFIKTGGTNEGKLWSNGTIGAFCIELAEPRYNYSLTYDVIKPSSGPRPTTFLGSAMGETKAMYLQELWGRYYDPGWVTGDTYTDKQNSQAAVFAACIWEIVHENFSGNPLAWDVTVDGTPGTGGFASDYVNSIIANNWLHSLDGTGPMADLRIFSYDGMQDFLVAVPEPATMVLLGMGSALGLLRRKKKA